MSEHSCSRCGAILLWSEVKKRPIGISEIYGVMQYKLFCGKCYDEEINKKPFETTQKDLMKYNGQDFEIIRELTTKEIDIDDVGRTYKIKFADGFITDVLHDAILCLISY